MTGVVNFKQRVVLFALNFHTCGLKNDDFRLSVAVIVSSRTNGNAEKQRFLTPLATMTTHRCGVGTAVLDDRLIAIGNGSFQIACPVFFTRNSLATPGLHCNELL